MSLEKEIERCRREQRFIEEGGYPESFLNFVGWTDWEVEIWFIEKEQKMKGSYSTDSRIDGEKLRTIRKARGLTQLQCAVECGVSVRTIEAVERNENQGSMIPAQRRLDIADRINSWLVLSR